MKMICSCKSFTRNNVHRRLIYSTTKIIPKENLPAPAYKPEIVEKNKYDNWEKKRIFEAKINSDDTTFSIVLPPPNVTGKLHLGHALSSTIQDVIVRRQRSMGQNVLWLPGTDHAGIATQSVVEKYLKTKQNIDRHDIGRKKFIEEVWKWKEIHGNTINKQLRMLGCSLDWSREVFTMDKKHMDAVNKAFIKLYKKGLIYRRKALVNWCNALKSTVSDIEVENKTINGPTEIMLPGYEKVVKFGLIYNFAYKVWDSDEEIVVSTTMPETMLGDTAVAVHPEDARYIHLKGKKVVHPFRNTTIPIIFDGFVDMKFGTGVVKITPAHSKVDNGIARHHNLPLLQVINEDGVMENSGKFNGIKKFDCREILVDTLDSLGLLKSVSPHQMTLPICSRTGDVIEHLPKEQWFLSCNGLNEKARQAVEDKSLKIEPDKFEKNWINWTSDNRDWCISRQLWWGHQIPAYKCSADKNIVWIAATDELYAKHEASKYLRTLPEEITVERDTDVLDTWFSSGIYPFAALGWPQSNKGDYQKFYPINLMVTGHDILGFWVHRMIMLGIELTGNLPFNKVLLHGIICDSKGAKMSKSRGNVIDPMDIIKGISLDGLKEKVVSMHKDGILNDDELKKAISYHKSNFSNSNGIPECGVDALRFTLLSNDIKSHFVSFDVYQCHANKLFCNKIWQSIKYTQISYDKLKGTNEELTVNDLTYFDKWILSRLSNMVENVNKSLDLYDFHLATKSLRTMIYNEFCDIYLEATKPGFDSDVMKTSYAHAHTLSAVLETSLRCLSPFMVYLTDELITKIPAFETNIIHNFKDQKRDYFDFPNSKDFQIWKDLEFEKQVNKLLNSVFLIREVKGFYNIPNKIRSAIFVKSTDDKLISDLKGNKVIIQNLSKTGDITINENINTKVINVILDKDTEISVEIPGTVESTAIREKLQKKINKIEDNLLKLEARLTSNHYVNTVSELSQELDKEKLISKREELKRLRRLI
nr:valine--tRNA ligase, mitochondrial 1 [Vanessa tameamea]